MEKREKFSWYEICTGYLFPIVLALYPLRHIHWGLDLMDTGYNYANFQYMGLESMDSMWLYSTYLANVVGNLLTGLPGASSLLGMNFYTAFFVSLLALMGYYFCTKVLRIPAAITFLGEFAAVSLCWCPTALLYNYLTYVLFLGSVVFLYLGLTREKNLWLVVAGVLLGTNVFVRFSNLPQAAMILAVWGFGVVCRKKFRKVVRETGWCLLGYISALGIWLGWIALRYGLSDYVAGIVRLFAMTEDATDYKPTSMLVGLVLPFLQNFYWAKWLLVLVAAGIVGFLILPGRFEKVKKVGFAGLAVTAMGWLYARGFCSLIFSDYNAMLGPGILFLMLSLLVCVLLVLGKKVPEETKLVAGMILLIIPITSLGSNNGVFPSLNNLFFVLPFVLWQFYLFCNSGRTAFYPVKAVAAAFLLLFIFQSIGFGTGFVFVEGAGAKNIDTKVENNDILKGISMSEERAVWMNQISAYVSEQGLEGRELIAYGKIPAMSFYLQMPPAFNAWSDLRSYSVQTMKADLAELERQLGEGKEKPVVLLGNTYVVEGDPKWQLLEEFMKEYEYEQTFCNERFTMFE